MRRIPNFASLKAFEAAARLSSFTAAANELHLSPSAVSHQVKNLEAGLGVALFVRQVRRVELTAEGRQLAGSLSPALDALERACAPWLPAPRSLHLSVHCSPSFASKWLAPRLGRLMSLPDPLSIRLSSSATPVDLTRHEDVDVAITYGAPLQRAGVAHEALGEETIAPLCSPAMLAPGQPLVAGDLAHQVLIDSQLSPVRWADWFRRQGIEPPAQPAHPSFDRAALALSAAADGLGIALESTRLAEEELRSGRLQVLQGQGFHILRPMHFLCYRDSQRNSRKIDRFREWLLAELAGAERDA